MFGPDPFSRNHIRRLNLHNPLVFPPTYDYTLPRADARPHRHHHHRRHSLFALDIEGCDLSSPDATEDDAYHLDSDTSLDMPPPGRRAHTPHRYAPDVPSRFHDVSVRLPARSPRLDSDEILILPASLTRLRISIRAHGLSSSTHHGLVRAVVAGDLRFCDVLEQLVSPSYHGDVRGYVKVRGEWIEPGVGVKMSDLVEQRRFVMGERREMEVKIVVGGVRERRGGRGVMEREWERELGRGWEWRG